MTLDEFIDDYSFSDFDSWELAQFSLKCEDKRVQKLANRYLTSRFAFINFIEQNGYKWR